MNGRQLVEQPAGFGIGKGLGEVIVNAEVQGRKPVLGIVGSREQRYAHFFVRITGTSLQLGNEIKAIDGNHLDVYYQQIRERFDGKPGSSSCAAVVQVMKGRSRVGKAADLTYFFHAFKDAGIDQVCDVIVINQHHFEFCFHSLR